MENFFTYISKPVDKEDLQIWIDGNNICHQKFELFNDFVLSLINLIYVTYLGDDIDANNETKVVMSEKQKKEHFLWCWNKTIENFNKENITFVFEEIDYNYFESFFYYIFYNK